MEKNDLSEGVEFIHRKKKPPIFEKIRNDFNLFLVKANYENGGLLFKIIYDKYYRPELYKYLSNSDINVPNKTRTFLTFNKENFQYKPLLRNEEILEKNLQADEIFTENLYLLKSNKVFKYSIINKYSSIVLFLTLFGGLIFQRKIVSIPSGLGLLANASLYINLNYSMRVDLQIYQQKQLSHIKQTLIYNLYKVVFNEL